MNIEIDFIMAMLKTSDMKTTCHETTKTIAKMLGNKGYNVKIITGSYVNYPKAIKHSWIEFKDKILETDCRQLREECDMMPNEAWAVLDKSKFAHRYIKEE